MDRRTFLRSTTAAAVIPFVLAQAGWMPLIDQPSKDAKICLRTFELAVSKGWQAKPIGDIVVEIGKTFLGAPYVANSLEQTGAERLVINLRAFDCVTFYENCLALARCIKKNELTFEAYCAELTLLRYRGGVIDGYPSRLHYTSDYFYDNERKGVLRDVTKEIGGGPFVKKIDFMSTHVDAYPALNKNPQFVPMIAAQEAEITKREKCHVPKGTLADVAGKICDGDIIGITTSIEGLDMTHTGIAVWKDGDLHFLHAPITGANVQITELPLTEYLARIRKDAGVMVARPQEPGSSRQKDSGPVPEKH
jgi:hypothetical protein